MTDPVATAKRTGPGRLPGLVLFSMGIGLCCWWSITYTRGPLGLSTLWVASGVLCAFLLTSPRAAWPGYLVGAFVASLAVNVFRNGVSPVAFVLSFANVLDAWLVALVVSSRIKDVTVLAQIRQSVTLATIATLAACSLSGAMASLARGLSANAPGPIPHLFATWVASHVLGMAIFATMTIVARVEGHRLLGPPGRRLELFATLAFVAAVCLLVFAQKRYSVGFLVFPPLLLCVFRHRFSGFVPATALVAVIATMETSAGNGPFVLEAPNDFERTWMLQVYIASACLLAFPMAAVLTERKLLAGRLAKSEFQYRMLADYSRDLVIRIGADGTRHYISPSATELLGWSREELQQPRWELVHPEDAATVQQTLRELFASGGSATVRFRTRHKDGHYLWIEANARGVPGAQPGAPPEVIYAGRDVTRRIEAEQALERLARHDTLTGLANRFYFNERIQLAIARQQRNARRLALLYLDVDHFKQINDTHGHAAGDEVLRQFVARLNRCLRANDFAARLGGDEFVVLVEDFDDEQAPITIAEKLIAALRDEMMIGDVRLRVSTSIGIGLLQRAPSGPDQLMHLADEALYAAKAAGRNTWRMAKQVDAETGQGPGA